MSRPPACLNQLLAQVDVDVRARRVDGRDWPVTVTVSAASATFYDCSSRRRLSDEHDDAFAHEVEKPRAPASPDTCRAP